MSSVSTQSVWLATDTVTIYVIVHMFTDGSLLCVSLTVNTCSLSYFVCGRLAEFFSTKYADIDKNGFLAKVCDLHSRKPWILGKTITELLVTCVLIILSVTTLSITSVSTHPFSGNQTASLDPLIQTVMSANIGRYVFMCVQDSLLHQHLTHFKTDLIHHLVTIGAYIVFLVFKQNLLLSVSGLLMELNVIPIEIGRLVRQIDKTSPVHRRLAIASCTVTMVSRGVLPIVFLAISLRQESPFTMGIASLTVFFLCIVFFFVINFWMILQTLSRVIKYSPCGPGEVDETNQNCVTVRNLMEPQSRDIILPGAQGDRQSVTFSNLNYGYLKSYDNRNVCNNENDKINYSTKKVSKPNLAYKGPKLPHAPAGTETDNFTNNSVEVAHNNFNRRVHFQDETDSRSCLPSRQVCIIDSPGMTGRTRNRPSTGSNCSPTVLIPPNITNILTEPPISVNGGVTSLSDTMDIPIIGLEDGL